MSREDSGGPRDLRARGGGTGPVVISSPLAQFRNRGFLDQHRRRARVPVHVRISHGGHPDKLCDQVSDAILDSIIREDPEARVACETATTTGLVIVLGEITTKTYVDFQQVVRDTSATSATRARTTASTTRPAAR
jgi:hypothetical protein